MSEPNPFQAPASDVDHPITSTAGELTEPRIVPAGRGWGWLTGGFDVFRRGWLIWIVNVIIFGVIVIVLNMIPFVSIVSAIFSTMLMGGLMAGCLALDQGNELTVGHLFEGFRRNVGSLAAVGALYLVGIILLFIIAGAAGYGTLTTGGEVVPATSEEALAQIAPTIALISLFVLALSIPLIMAIWFAPALVMLHDVGAVEAMKLSFRGCLRNILPFLVYGIVVLVLLSLAAILAVMLLLPGNVILAALYGALSSLILFPMLIASVYVAYKDIFLKNA